MSDPANEIIEPEDSENVSPTSATSSIPAIPETAAERAAAVASDADAEVPVPVAMEPAEIDERAQVIEALNRSDELP